MAFCEKINKLGCASFKMASANFIFQLASPGKKLSTDGYFGCDTLEESEVW